MSFWLEFSKDGQTQQFSFDRDRIMIGRDREADFVIDHPTVSRQHGLITADQRGFHLTVLSRGGMTAIGGQQVQGEVPLYDGTEVYFGSQQFTFRSNNAPPAPRQSGGWQPQPQNGGWDNSGMNPAQAQPQNGGWDNSGMNPAQAQPQNGGWDNSGMNPAQAQPQNGGWESSGMNPAQAQPQNGGWESSGMNPAQAQPQNGGWQQPSGPQQAADPHAGQQWDAGWDQPAQPEPQQEVAEDFITWGEIAANADSEASMGAKRDIPAPEGGGKKKKTNPMLLVGLVAMVGLVGYAYIAPMLKPPPPPPPPPIAVPTGQIEMAVDCVGAASCKKEALNAFKVGSAAQERSNADIANLYEAHYQFTRAQKLLEQGAIKETPSELAGMRKLHEPVKKQLQTYFQQERVKFRDARKKKDADRMKAAILTVKAYVPDNACDYNKWAEAREDEMQDKGIWPADVDAYGRPISN